MDSTRKERLTLQSGRRNLPQENVYTFKVDLQTCDSTTLEQTTPEHIFTGAAPIQSPTPGDMTEANLPRDQGQLPDFIAPLPNDLDPDVLQLLHTSGALTLPSRGMVDQLLMGFVCYVYPMLPIFDLGNFLSTVDGTSGSTISLVLFQAVMFAGSTFVDLAHLQHEGFQSLKDARKILFGRVKLLYEMDVESNPMTMIQVLLLMTYWYGQQNDTKGRFYWLRTAWSLAMDIGLDRHQQFSNDPDRQRMSQKLWCCCLIRDKLLSITERRQSANHSNDWPFPFPHIRDFDDAALTQALNKFYMSGRGVEAPSLGQLFAQKVKLCLIIGRILDSQYELSGLRRVNSSETYMVLIPKVKATNVEAAARDQELREWYAETSAIREAGFGRDHRSNGRVLGVHSATLEMLYYTALSTVHRPQLLHDQPKESAAGVLQGFSRTTLRSAARRISEIGRHMEEGNLVRLMSPLAVGAHIAASIQHLKDALSPDAELRETGRLYLGQTLHAFAALRKMYNSADCAIGFIERVRSGQLLYQSFEWEDRANYETLQDPNAVLASNTQAAPSSIVQTSIGSTPSPHNTRMGPQKDTGQRLTDTPRSPFGHDEYSVFHSRGLNIETVSEMLLSAPFDASDVDWASMDWSHVETMAI